MKYVRTDYITQAWQYGRAKMEGGHTPDWIKKAIQSGELKEIERMGQKLWQVSWNKDVLVDTDWIVVGYDGLLETCADDTFRKLYVEIPDAIIE